MLPKKKYFSSTALKLISSFRGIPEDATELSKGGVPITIGEAVQQAFMHKLPSNSRIRSIELLNLYWKDWFKGTDFYDCQPQRVDKWNCLWIKVPNAIVRQKLHFKTVQFLSSLNSLLPKPIKEVRWII